MDRGTFSPGCRKESDMTEAIWHAPACKSSYYINTLSYKFHVYVSAKLLLLCPTLSIPVDCSLPGSSVQRILQAGMLEWVAMPSSRRSSRPRDRTCISYVSCISRQVLYHWRHLRSPGLRQNLRICIFNRFPRIAKNAGYGTAP